MKNNLGNKHIMATNIRRYLELRHMSIKELAAAIDVPYNTVGDWTRAEAYPRIDKIERMANVFKITKADLVEDPRDLRAEVLDRAFRDRPDLRTLFEAADKATPEDIERVIKILNAFNGE